MNINTQEIKELLFSLSGIMSVSGGEKLFTHKLKELTQGLFDEYEEDPNGGHIFIKRADFATKGKLLIDAHFDEIGFMVTDILEGGFLAVTNIGGINTRILPAARIYVYGKETIPAYFASTPPHLRKKGEGGNAPTLSSLLLDTGMDTATLKETVSVGTLCGFASAPAELMADCVCGHGFDNKACCTAAIMGVAAADRSKMKYDVYLHLAGREEVGCVGGRTGAYSIDPDIAIVLDVEFASMPGVREDKTVKRGKGPSLTVSPVCDKRLTDNIADIAKECGIDYQTIVYSMRTGTDTDTVNITASGIPCALMGIPLSGMHTAEETVCLRDIEAAAKLIAEFAERGEKE